MFLYKCKYFQLGHQRHKARYFFESEYGQLVVCSVCGLLLQQTFLSVLLICESLLYPGPGLEEKQCVTLNVLMSGSEHIGYKSVID